MGEFEKSRIEGVLKNLSKKNLCTILEATGLSIEDCWEKNIGKAKHPILLKKVSSRIDELSQEHFEKEKESMERRRLSSV